MPERKEEPVRPDNLLAMIRSLDQRIARIEAYLEIGVESEKTLQPARAAENLKLQDEDEDELEFEVGQKWFAKVGIVVLAIGMAFVLTFPYKNLPPVVPSLFGYVVAVGMFLLARLWRSSLTLISHYLVGAGLLLLYFATLRLFFFAADPPLVADSIAGIFLLTAVVTFILSVSLRRESVYLTGMSLVLGYCSVIVIDHTFAVLAGALLFSVFSVVVRLRFRWNSIFILAIISTYLTHFVWAVGNPFLGHTVEMVTSPMWNIWFLLCYASVFAAGILLREDNRSEAPGIIISSFLNVTCSYTLFLVLTLTSFGESFVLSHLVVSAVYLTLAILFWKKERSRYSTFLYAMFGYAALSVALLKAASPPAVFVWLSLQSILVLSTAIWFRSRFIVVANFVIFLAIVIGYLIVTQGENGMSVGFGVVALVSARILNWQRDRLELKTEMMRNAYLTCGFFAFPYALYFLMPAGYVSLSWVGVALLYYLLGAFIGKQKYRWMGHLTLGVTVLYVMIIGIIQLEESYRILSFLVLGFVLVVVSIVFTRLRSKRLSERSRHQD